VALIRASAFVSHLFPEGMQEISFKGYTMTWALWIDLILFLPSLSHPPFAVGLAHVM
jgi:hypothetical protein